MCRSHCIFYFWSIESMIGGYHKEHNTFILLDPSDYKKNKYKTFKEGLSLLSFDKYLNWVVWTLKNKKYSEF